MGIVMVILLLLALVALYFILHKPKPSHSEPVHQHPYSAVRVKPHEHACNAAFDMSHRTFLVAEAPVLPLRDCDKTESCRCGYRHYDDRRQGKERRGESIVMIDSYNKKERRDDVKHGRRKDD